MADVFRRRHFRAEKAANFDKFYIFYFITFSSLPGRNRNDSNLKAVMYQSKLL